MLIKKKRLTVLLRGISHSSDIGQPGANIWNRRVRNRRDDLQLGKIIAKQSVRYKSNVKFCTGRQKCPKVSISVFTSQNNVSLTLVCDQDRAQV